MIPIEPLSCSKDVSFYDEQKNALLNENVAALDIKFVDRIVFEGKKLKDGKVQVNF